MKKAIVLSAALLLAGAAAFAADVKFSGRIRVGYKFTFGDSDSIGLKKNPEGRLNLGVADPDGLWSITFDTFANGTDKQGFSDHYVRARATVGLDKALKNAGVDLGDVSLSLFGGYNDLYETKNVYKDGPFSDNDLDRMDLNVAEGSAEASIVGVDVGYQKLVKVEAVAAPAKTLGDGSHGASFAFTATSTPYDGVDVGVGYGHNVALGKGTRFGRKAATNAISASANVDVAKLIGTKDYSLGVAADFLYGFKDSDKDQDAYVQPMVRVNGGIDLVDGYVEYAYTGIDNDADDKAHYLRAQANLNVVEGLDFDVYYQDYDLTNEYKNDDFEIGAEAAYTFGGVTYHLDLAYEAEKDNKNFAITPWIQIAF